MHNGGYKCSYHTHHFLGITIANTDQIHIPTIRTAYYNHSNTDMILYWQLSHHFFGTHHLVIILQLYYLLPRQVKWSKSCHNPENIFSQVYHSKNMCWECLTLTSIVSMYWPDGIVSMYFFKSMDRNSNTRYNLFSCINTSSKLKYKMYT